MTKITSQMVKDLRRMTGAGIMDCKSALIESNGDFDKANDFLRKKGMKLVDKKIGRNTNEGLIGVNIKKDKAYIVEINCETDFVARTEKFQKFVINFLNKFTLNDEVEINEELTQLIAELGENIQINRKNTIKQESVLAGYIHNEIAPGLGKLGVIVSIKGNPSDELAVLAKKIAMHIAAANPIAINYEQLDKQFIDKERQFFTEQALESGKSEKIIEKMVDGKLKKRLREVLLVNQSFIMNNEKTVGIILEENNAEVVDFIRYKIGE